MGNGGKQEVEEGTLGWSEGLEAHTHWFLVIVAEQLPAAPAIKGLCWEIINVQGFLPSC